MAEEARAQEAVTLLRDGDVLVLLVDHPPLNALDPGLCTALARGIDLAAAEPGVAAVVIRSAGRVFLSGSDGRTTDSHGLADLCNRIEACNRPVIAAVQGAATGGGLELALAAHGRVALATARVGLPDVHLGLVPGAGATQRLPRLIGAEQALRLLVQGVAVTAAEALALGLLDQVVETGLEDAALALARAQAGRPPRASGALRCGMRDPVAYQAAVAACRKAQGSGRLPAPGRIIDCVEAALLLPLDQGLAFERAASLDMAASPEAAALRHVHAAERLSAGRPEVRVAARPSGRIGVFGPVPAAADLALMLVSAGHEVTLAAADRPALVAGLERLAARQERAVQAGRQSAAARNADWARLTAGVGARALAGADLVLLWPGFVADGPVAGVGGAGLALHLVPSGGGRFAEIVVPGGGQQAVAMRLEAVARRLGRVVLRSAVPGGIGASVLGAGRRAAAHLVVQGLAPDRLRAALNGFGFAALGPETGPDGPSGTDAEQEQSSGAGRLVLPQADVLARLLAAMANEGARLLGAGLVQRPSDIDLAMVLGQGFPRWQGGPMFWADRRGLLLLRRDLRDWAAKAPQLYTPAPLIEELFRQGRRLDSLNS